MSLGILFRKKNNFVAMRMKIWNERVSIEDTYESMCPQTFCEEWGRSQTCVCQKDI